MKNIFATFIFCVISFFFLGQGTQFNFAYGNSGLDNGRNIVEASNGLFYVIGSSSSQNGNTDVLVFCIDQNGNMIWSNYYGTNQTDIGVDIALKDNDKLIIFGYTNGMGSGGYDLYLAELSLDGDLQWEKTYGGDDWELAHDLESDSSGQYYLVGETYSYGSGNNDAYVLLVNENGDILWENTYGSEGNEMARKIDIYSDGQVAFIGSQKLSGTNNFNTWIVQLDQFGVMINSFTQSSGFDYDEFGQDLIVYDDKIIFISTTPDSMTSESKTTWSSIDTNLDYNWQRTTENHLLVGLMERDLNTFLMIGADLNEDCFTSIFTTGGGWPATVNSQPVTFDLIFNAETYYNGILTEDGGFICTGNAVINSDGQTSSLVTKFDSTLVTEPLIDLSELPVGIIDIDTNYDISIFPNPVTNKLEIRIDDVNEIFDYQFIDLLGKSALSGSISRNGISLDTRSLQVGVYTLILSKKNGHVLTRKVVKQ